MPFDKDPNEIGCLWSKTGNKGDYLTGEINGEKVVCFAVKSNNPKAPSWRVLKSQPRERDEQSEGTRRLDTREAPRRASRVDDTEDFDF